MVKQYKIKALRNERTIERNDFVNMFNVVFNTDELINIEVMCQENTQLESFYLYYNDDEFYIIDLCHSVIIGWYKHLGRCAYCSNDELTNDDIRDFLYELKREIEER